MAQILFFASKEDILPVLKDFPGGGMGVIGRISGSG
ncbi:hypothetical protein Cflav_PD1174 [Pedosphaera parvula Ellin514]|uniref:Uncharacterized protein n=1 Tax=Pedosphaera parvula (strain Ellin514) TaxID=320771 RepID=B9XQ33_PEDPL|nr:hypothetical protein Cflav_PD1174 [Pedosphaera parvula Ellin514]